MGHTLLRTSLRLSGAVLALASLHLCAATLYVDLKCASPAWPFATWATAATTIQEAVDVAAAGDDIVVTNGIYQAGGQAVYGMSNRVAVTKPVSVQSVNGPEVTTVVGYQVPWTTNGDGAVRCVYLTNGAVLAGFTLTQGATQSSGDVVRQQSGGGVWCESTNCTVSNCILTTNAAVYGGGASGGTLSNCALTANSADTGGGAYEAKLDGCALTGNWAIEGGGTRGGTLNSCTLVDNWASWDGGGAYNAALNNCILMGNSALGGGGGVQGGTLENCTLMGNSEMAPEIKTSG